MLNINHISQCQKHKKFINLVVLDRDICILSCPECFISSHKKQQHPKLQMQKGIFICEESRLFFKQWTTSVANFLKQILAESEPISVVINFNLMSGSSPNHSSNIINTDKASRIINVVLQQQIAVFQGNLAYVCHQNLQQLTHHIFLMDLYNMVMIPPQKTLELILDKFKKTCQAHSKILRYPLLEQQIQQLQFSQYFIDRLNQITTDKMGKYGQYFFLDLNVQNKYQFKCFQPKQWGKQAEKSQEQIEAVSEYEGESQNESMKISEIMEKRVVMGHDKRKDSGRKSQLSTPKKEPKFIIPQETIQKQLSTQFDLNLGPQTPINIREPYFSTFLQKQPPTEVAIKVNAIVEILQKQNKKFKGLKQELGDQIQNINLKLNQINAITQASKENFKDFRSLTEKFQESANIAETQSLKKQLQQKIEEIESYKRQIAQKNDEWRELREQFGKIEKLSNEEVSRALKLNSQFQSQNQTYAAKVKQLMKQNAELAEKLSKLQAKNYEQEKYNNKERQMKLYSQISELNNINQEFIKLLKQKDRVIQDMTAEHEDNIAKIKEKMNKQFQILLILQQEQLNAAKKEISEQNRSIKQAQLQIQAIREQANAQQLRLQAQFNLKEKELQKDFTTLLQKTQNYSNLLEDLVKKVQEQENELQQLSTKISELSSELEQHKTAKNNQTVVKEEDKSEKINSEANEILWNLIIQQLHMNIEELTTKYSTLEQQLMRKDKGFQELNSALQEQTKRCELALKQSNQQGQEIQKLNKKIRDSQTQIEQKQQKIEQNHQLIQRLNANIQLLEEKNAQNQKIKQAVEIHTNKYNQLQQINKQLVTLDKEKDQEINILQNKINSQIEMMNMKQDEIKKLNSQSLDALAKANQKSRQKDQLEEANRALREDLAKLQLQYSELKQNVEHLNQQITEIKQAEMKRDQEQNYRHELHQRQNQMRLEQRAKLQQKLAELQEKMEKFEEQINRRAEYDDQFLQQLINAESECKAKQFEINKLLNLYFEIVGQLDEAKRKKYIEAVSKYKPTRVKTQ